MINKSDQTESKIAITNISYGNSKFNDLNEAIKWYWVLRTYSYEKNIYQNLYIESENGVSDINIKLGDEKALSYDDLDKHYWLVVNDIDCSNNELKLVCSDNIVITFNDCAYIIK